MRGSPQLFQTTLSTGSTSDRIQDFFNVNFLTILLNMVTEFETAVYTIAHLSTQNGIPLLRFYEYTVYVIEMT